jgi:hypothetical protein
MKYKRIYLIGIFAWLLVLACSKGPSTENTVYLRKGDQLRELSADINLMTKSLNNNVTKIKADVERIMISASNQNTPEWFQQKLQQLHEQISLQFKL